MKHCWLASILLAAGAACAEDLPRCKVSVFHLNEMGALGSEPVLGPEHIQKVEPFKDVVGEAFPEITQWLVTLNAKGAEISRSYTARNLGRKVAVLCDGREVSRPVIRSVLRDQLVFGVLKEAQ